MLADYPKGRVPSPGVIRIWVNEYLKDLAEQTKKNLVAYREGHRVRLEAVIDHLMPIALDPAQPGHNNAVRSIIKLMERISKMFNMDVSPSFPAGIGNTQINIQFGFDPKNYPKPKDVIDGVSFESRN